MMDLPGRNSFLLIITHPVYGHIQWLSIISLDRPHGMDNAFSYAQFFLLTCSLDFMEHFIACCVEKNISLYGEVVN